MKSKGGLNRKTKQYEKVSLRDRASQVPFRSGLAPFALMRGRSNFASEPTIFVAPSAFAVTNHYEFVQGISPCLPAGDFQGLPARGDKARQNDVQRADF